MKLDSRLKRLELATGGSEPDLLIFRTIYEDQDGGIADEHSRATIVWAEGKSVSLQSREDESYEEFEERVKEYEALTWDEPQTT